MDTLYKTVKEFVGFGFKIKSALDKAKHNKEECRRIDALLLSVRAIAKHLQGSPNIMEDDLMRVTTEGLDKALELASKLVAKCKGKRFLDHAFNAKDIAEKLHGACFDVLFNMNTVLLANGVLNTSQLAELKEIVAQLRADVTNTNSMLAKILQILAAARPDVDLPQEVEKLVKDDQISFQTKNKGGAKKTAVASSQNKNNGEAKKTDVARTEVKNQKKNKKLGRSTVVPDASLPDGLAESASAASVVGQGSSTIVAARPDVDLPEEVEKLVKDDQMSSQIKNKREKKKTGVPSFQNKNKGEAKETDVARPEVKIKNKKKLGGTKVVPHASLLDGLAESASAPSVVEQGSSTIIINKAQSVGVSAAPLFHPREIISISKEPRETGGYKIYTRSSETSKLLEVYPQRLLFPLEPKNEETTRWPVTLTNKTNHSVGIWIKPINEQFTKAEIMGPDSTLVVYATMKTHAQPPKDTVKFEVLMIIVQSERDHEKLEPFIVGKLNMDSDSMVHVKKLKGEVYRAMLTPITCDPASCQIISRSIEKMNLVTSIDAHPTKPWIVMGHEGGNFSIWDYQKQETVMKLQVNKVPDKVTRMIHGVTKYIKETSLGHPVYSVKFTAEGKWLVVGDGHGYIYVYDCTNTKLHEVNKIGAYDKKSVNSLAAHPTKPYLLLSSSAFSKNMRLWDWSTNKEKFQNFKVKPENTYYVGVHSVKFNPRDTNTFACVTDEGRVEVWNIETSSLETTLKGPFAMADYFFTRGHENLMVTLTSGSHNSEIWDLKTRKVVHTLSVSGHKTTWVACHPKLPILVTMLDDETVCLWDASTYRLEKMVHITDGKCRDLVFVPDTNGPLRLAIAFKTMIAIMEVNLPIANTSNASGLIMGTN